MTELKPCPFCGGKAELIKIPVSPYPDKYYVRCSNQNDCKVAAHTYMGGTAEEAIEDWNRRAAFTTAHSEWINVKDRLPEEYKDVLCYYEYFRYGDFNCMFRTIDRGHYGNGIWGGEAGQGHKNKVLAWMPLPEPPREEQ